jgi:hypothetical protein
MTGLFLKVFHSAYGWKLLLCSITAVKLFSWNSLENGDSLLRIECESTYPVRQERPVFALLRP